MATEDTRCSFEEAKALFVAGLKSQYWPTQILWLSRDRVLADFHHLWIFRPHELTSDEASRMFYEAARATESSIRLDAIGILKGNTIAYVQDWGGEGKHLNLGVSLDKVSIKSVSSKAYWGLRRWLVALRGENTMMKMTVIPPKSTI